MTSKETNDKSNKEVFIYSTTLNWCRNVYVDLYGHIRPKKFPRSGLWYFDGQVFYQKLEFFESMKGNL